MFRSSSSTKKRPDIFVSATSSDPKSVRVLVKIALLRIGCFPVEQSDFPTDYRSVTQMLRARIAECDTVIHIVGRCNGSEPPVETFHAVNAGVPSRN